jgi:hypothetical protein
MSGTIKENLIPQETSTDPEVLKDMFVRFVTALGTGSSKNKKVSELILKIANIYGLQTALDSKIGKNVSGHEGNIPSYMADGDIDFSTFKIGTFDSSASIGSLVDNGFYTAAGTGSAYENAIMGNVCAVFVFNNTQTVYSSDRGMWYRIYSIVDHYSAWSIPSYIGGSTSNIQLTYAQAEALATGFDLTPGTSYAIVDYTTTGYERIILRAATSSEFEQDGLAFLSVPIHRASVDDTIGGEPITFKGCWRSTGTYAYGDVVWFFGQMYSNLTGNTGSIRDTYFLNIADWNQLTPDTYPEFYVYVKHGVTYDFATNFVRKEWDEYGNEFGDSILQADGFQTRYNDWHLGIDDVLGVNSNFYGNRLRRCYNVSVDAGEPIIVNCSGDGDIRGSNAVSSLIYEGCEINGNAAYISIFGATDVLIYNTVINVPLNGDIEYLRGCVVEGQINGCYGVYAENTIFHKASQINGWDFNGYTLFNSEIYGTHGAITLSGDTEIKQSKGSIFASLYIGAGEFSYTRGGTFQSPVLGSGCAVNTVASNGVTISGANISTLAITIVHSGYYNIKYEATAQSPVKLDVESKVYKGATAIPMLYNKKTYTAIDEWINSSISGIVQLAAGDVITAKYASTGSGTATLLLGQINVTIEYKGQ